MPERERTDPKALDAMWTRSVVEPLTRPRWYCHIGRGLWRFLREDLWRAPVETYPDESPVLRRIRIHEWGTSLARRLRKIDPSEAREVLGVTAMLLGFEMAVAAEQPQEARR